MAEPNRIDVNALVTIIGDKEVQIFALRQQIQLLLEEREKLIKKDEKPIDGKPIKIVKKEETK